MDTLISNVTVVTMNEKMDVLFGAYIGIENGKIAYVGKTAPTEQEREQARKKYLDERGVPESFRW